VPRLDLQKLVAARVDTDVDFLIERIAATLLRMTELNAQMDRSDVVGLLRWCFSV
jgi:hypothetical protein